MRQIIAAAAAAVVMCAGLAMPAQAHAGQVSTGISIVGACSYSKAPCVSSVGTGAYWYVHSTRPLRKTRIWPATTGRLPGFTTTGGRRPVYYVVGLGARA